MSDAELVQREEGVMYGLPGMAMARARQALMLSGGVIQLEREPFLSILEGVEQPLVVVARSQFLRRVTYTYATSYKGLVCFTRGPDPLDLPPTIEVLVAQRIWMPNSLNL